MFHKSLCQICASLFARMLHFLSQNFPPQNGLANDLLVRWRPLRCHDAIDHHLLSPVDRKQVLGTLLNHKVTGNLELYIHVSYCWLKSPLKASDDLHRIERQ